jgi:hypothetical protein
MDQLVSEEDPTEAYDSDVEQARLASLEDSWAYNKTCQDKWVRFQPMLEHVKRVGAFDKTIQQVYDLLSILLYQYSYGIDALVPLDTLDHIEHRVKSIRLPDKELLQSVMDHLRSSL